uniref:Uncharacterized protein n=1 Tax=Setaria italica TaxID=4555 RepID=K4A3T6_SETIT
MCKIITNTKNTTPRVNLSRNTNKLKKFLYK